MQQPNENGAYQPDTTERVAEAGAVKVLVSICECEPECFRYGIEMTYADGGDSSPIKADALGYATYEGARMGAIEELFFRLCRRDLSSNDEHSRQLASVLDQLKQKLAQPLLF